MIHGTVFHAGPGGKRMTSQNDWSHGLFSKTALG